MVIFGFILGPLKNEGLKKNSFKETIIFAQKIFRDILHKFQDSDL